MSVQRRQATGMPCMSRTGDRGTGNNQKAAGFDTARPESLIEARTRQFICKPHAAVLYAILQSRMLQSADAPGYWGFRSESRARKMPTHPPSKAPETLFQ